MKRRDAVTHGEVHAQCQLVHPKRFTMRYVLIAQLQVCTTDTLDYPGIHWKERCFCFQDTCFHYSWMSLTRSTASLLVFVIGSLCNTRTLWSSDLFVISDLTLHGLGFKGCFPAYPFWLSLVLCLFFLFCLAYEMSYFILSQHAAPISIQFQSQNIEERA